MSLATQQNIMAVFFWIIIIAFIIGMMDNVTKDEDRPPRPERQFSRRRSERAAYRRDMEAIQRMRREAEAEIKRLTDEQ